MENRDYREGELRKLTDALGALGATRNAVSFYLSCYRSGASLVGDVARACGMDRSSAYNACEQLEALGLIERDAAASRKTVAARPPSAVLARLRTEARRMRRLHEEVEESMPELMAAFAAAPSKPVLRVFSGREGLRRITDDVLDQARGEILLFSNQRAERQVFNDADHREFIAERLRRGIAIRVLAADTPEARALRRADARSLRETRTVAGEPFASETYVYGDSVAMLSFDKDVVGFVVRSRKFAEQQRWVFETIWKSIN